MCVCMQLCARPHLSDWLRQRSAHKKVLNSLQPCLAQGKLDDTTPCLLLRVYMYVCACACVFPPFVSCRQDFKEAKHWPRPSSRCSLLPSELSPSIESSQHWAFVWGLDPCTNKPSVCRLLEGDWCLYPRPALPLYWLLCVSLTDCRVSPCFYRRGVAEERFVEGS